MSEQISERILACGCAGGRSSGSLPAGLPPAGAPDICTGWPSTQRRAPEAPAAPQQLHNTCIAELCKLEYTFGSAAIWRLQIISGTATSYNSINEGRFKAGL